MSDQVLPTVDLQVLIKFSHGPNMLSEMGTISFHYDLAFNQSVIHNYNQPFIKMLQS